MARLRISAAAFSPRRVAIALAALVLAWFSGWAALAEGFSGTMPTIAAKSPIGAGPALGKLSRMMMVLSMDPQHVDPAAPFPKTVPPEAVKLAKRAFAREPLSTDALSVLALDANARGQTQRALVLFQDVNRLSRRSALANIWLAQTALQRNDIDGTLRHFDEIFRTSESGRTAALQQFAVATANPLFRERLAQVLRLNPPWADEFWEAGAKVPAAARTLGVLRLALAQGTLKFKAESDAALAGQLIATGEFDLAAQLYRALAPSAAGQAGELVRNWDFARASVLPPVDCNTYRTGEFGSEVQPKDSVLAFSAINSDRSEVARQWISLPPGSYVFRAKLALGQGGGLKGRVYARLSCIGTGEFRDFELTGNAPAHSFTVAPGACRNYWLGIVAEPDEGSQGLDGELDFISIKPAGASGK
jgi:hypothetical protein